jgi:uncharacterized membrane protein
MTMYVNLPSRELLSLRMRKWNCLYCLTMTLIHLAQLAV